METKLARISQLSKENPDMVFTSLGHLINKEMLENCHVQMDGTKAVGIDGVTKEEYGRNLEENLEALIESLKKKSYKPKPARLVEIPKDNGKMRPLSIYCYEDKLVQEALRRILEASPKTIQKYLAIPEDQVPKSKEIARERQHQLAVKQKEQEIEEARQMALAGYPIEQIATLMHHPYKTIQNYLNPDFSITNGHYNVRIPGKLAPYEREVIELRSKGLTYPKIHDIICKKGYTGSVASLRMFMQKERTRMYEQNETEKPHSEYVQRKSLCQLVYKKLEDIGTITAKQYQEVLKKYPLLSELYALTKEFCNVLFSNNPAKLDEWINEAQKYDIPELQTFINGIKKDLTAVKNGIIYSYNNGLAEGSVNKIKVIKRIMYGRNSFELLKAKVLFGELFHVKFN